MSRAQLAVYAALAVVALLLGARWIGGGQDQPSGSIAYGSDGAAAGAAERDGLKVTEGAGSLIVHVAGAVRKPGVYKLRAGSRVADAIERAGGATRDALADGINLAAPVADGQQVVVPAPTGAPGTAGAGAAMAEDGPISLGTATSEQLEGIEGIGPVTAAAIIEFRDERGGLASIDELDEISGIGPTTMEALRTRLQP